MPQASTNNTFKPSAFPNTGGVAAVNGQTNGYEVLASDPSDLSTTSPRVWINSTTGIMKYTYNAAGTPIRTVTST